MSVGLRATRCKRPDTGGCSREYQKTGKLTSTRKAVGCGADNRRALARLPAVRTLRRSNRGVCRLPKGDPVQILTPVRRLDPTVFQRRLPTRIAIGLIIARNAKRIGL